MSKTSHSTEPGADTTPPDRIPENLGPAEPVPSDATPFAPIELLPPPPPPSAPGPQPYPPPQAWPGYSQPAPNPYAYPPYGYRAPHPPTGTNGMAIAALVLGICGFFLITPIVGLILGLVSLAAIGRSGQKGKGMAISAIVLSSLWIVLFATVIAVAVVNRPDPAHRDADGNVVSPGTVPIFGLHPKDCFTVPAGLIGATNANTRSLTVVPCSTPHDSEAFGSFRVAEDSYPGIDALRVESVTQCVKLLRTYLPDAASLPTGSRVEFIYPNGQAWKVGQHRVTCFLHFPAATMTGSMYRDPASYTADQRRFLEAVRPLADAVTQLNAALRSADLPVLRQRASDIADALNQEISALTAAPWPADVQPAVDALVAEHREAVRLWTQAAAATDVTTLKDDAYEADAAFDATDLKAVRTALALTTITFA
ncbi:MAG: DUF4190 domain-containing protein [Catenulispora sp.]